MNNNPLPTGASLSHPFPDFTHGSKRVKQDQTVFVKGYGKLKVHPIRLDDEKAMIQFHARLSEDSVYMRYFEYLRLEQRTEHERLVRICTNTSESYAIVMELTSTPLHPVAILAVGRLTKGDQSNKATFDTLIIEEKNISLLGDVLLRHLIDLAREFGFRLLTGELQVDDHVTLTLCRELGFSLKTMPEEALVQVAFDL